MKILRSLISASVAATLLTAPVVAQAAPLPARASTEVEGENLRGGFIIPLIAIVAIILGIMAAVNDGGDPPHSP